MWYSMSCASTLTPRAMVLLLVCLASVISPTVAQGTPADPSMDVLIVYSNKPTKDPIVLEAGKPVTLERGEAYDLACHFQPAVSAAWTVSWRKTAGAEFTNSSDTFVNGWLGSLFEDYELHFQNFSSTDAGFYWCEATDPSGRIRQTSAILQVVPEVTIHGVDGNGRVTPTVGSSVELRCEGAGYPVPKLLWTRSGIELGTSNSLLLPTISKESNGSYDCAATNMAGQAMRRADIVVVEPMRWITAPARNVVATKNMPLTIECEAKGTPTPVIEWAKFEDPRYKRIHELDAKTSITLNASDLHSGDRYVCIARSPYPCCHRQNTQTPLLNPFHITISENAPTTEQNDAGCALRGDCSGARSLSALASTMVVVSSLLITMLL